jgi:hypothetical protein
MDIATQTGLATVVDVQTTGVSWPAIAAGAVTAAALSLTLIALGAGLGLSAVSPWTGSGVSATTFKVGTGIYLLCVAVMSSAVGGYLAARLRTRWTGLHTNEVFFRDTAHGLITWAFATLISATVLGAATTTIVGGAAQAVGAASAAGPADMAVDKLFRGDRAPAGAGGTDAGRTEVTRLLTASFRDGSDVAAPDRTYVASVIAARTGISQADAERRVSEVITEAKQATDRARKAAASFALWLTASLLLGGFAASLAAVEGGQLRDGTWNDRRLTPRAI